MAFKRFSFSLLILGLLFSCSSFSADNEKIAPDRPLADGIAAIRAEAGPITVIPPKGYWVDNGREGVSMNSSGETESTLIGIRVTDSSGQSADMLIENFMDDLPTGWNRLIEDHEIGNLVGRNSRYSIEAGPGEFVTGRVVALTSTSRDYLIFAVMDREDWISQGSADFASMLATIQIDDQSEQVNQPIIDVDTVEEIIEKLPTRTPNPTATPVLQSLPPFSGLSADGYACVSGFDTGLNCIRPNGEWLHYTEDNSDLYLNSIFDMTSCPDGRILMVDARWLTLFDGAEFFHIEQPEEFLFPDTVGCGPNGEIWLVHFSGVSAYRDDKWEFFDKSDLVKDSETVLEDIAIAADGTVWVMSFNEISRLAPNGTDWTIFAEGDGLDGKYFFDSLTLDENDTPYLTHSGGYVWFEGGRWIEQESEISFLGDIAVSADQEVYLGTFSDGLLTVDGDSVSTQTTADGLSRNNIDLIEVDQQNRIWIMTETGIDIFDGSQWTQLRMDNSELAHNQLRHLVVIGDGPSIPQTGQKPPGSITGQLADSSGNLLANSQVTLCISGLLSYSEPTENPCMSSAESFSVETDSDGRFLFEEIPSAWYELFFFVDGEWQELKNVDGILNKNVLIEPDLTNDIGLYQAEPSE